MSAKHEAERGAERAAQDATRRARANAEAEAAAAARRNDPELQARWAMALERLDGDGAASAGLPKASLSGFALALEAFEAGCEGTAEAGLALRRERLAQSRDRARAQAADPIRAAEREMRQDRVKALAAVRKQLGRRLDTVEHDPFNAMARGLISDGKHLRALSPTPQLGLLAVPYKNRGALISPRQLAAFSVFHAAWLGAQVGVGAVDAARIRVDGGGGGDAGWRMAKAADSLKAFRAMRIAVRDRWRLQLVDHVVLFDNGLESFNCPSIAIVKDRKMQAGMRLSMLLAAADDIARQVWA